jgi:hypothetical protein
VKKLIKLHALKNSEILEHLSDCNLRLHAIWLIVVSFVG